MTDSGWGIKAGVATGGVYIAISVILAAIGHRFWYPSDLLYAAGLGIPVELASPSYVIDLILVFIVPYIVRGVVFGAVFAALYSYVLGLTGIVKRVTLSFITKGVVLSLFLWILAMVQIIYTTPGWPWHADGFSGSGTYYSGMISLSSAGQALAGIISALVFGALVGAIWSRLKAKKMTEEREGRPVLLVSFILGGVLWALGAAPLLIGVVIQGGPAIDHDFWWRSMLYISAAFLGLPGWVLTLVGWRKAKVDKSGFKWGVVGGAVMVVTGIMLLPGVLGIIGGMLSRQKAAGEPAASAIAQ